MSRPRCFTLFRGGGGWELLSGCQPVGGVEIDPAVAAVCDANVGGPPTWVADVAAVAWQGVPAHEVGLCSPSCKNASSAKIGGRETPGDRAAGRAICAYLLECRPALFFLENVWGYRTFLAFQEICAALISLGYIFDTAHALAADWGVPQTRRRLILRATRGGGLPPLRPTHKRGGDWFHAPWVGWYDAIADLVDTLPTDQFAPWQLARLPWLAETLLVPGANDFRPRPAAAPAITITGNASRMRAYLVEGTGTGGNRRPQVKGAAEPAWTLRAASRSDSLRASLVDCQYSGTPGRERRPTFRPASSPAYTITAGCGSARPARAWLGRGRVVRLTPRALARLQTIPDTYVLPSDRLSPGAGAGRDLTGRIIGQAIPPLWARAIILSCLPHLRGAA